MLFYPGEKLYIIVNGIIKPVTVIKSDMLRSLVAFQHKGHVIVPNNELYRSAGEAYK